MYLFQLLINGISNGAVYAIIAVGWALIFSILKFSNLAHGGTMVCGAYIGLLFARLIGGNLLLVLIASALFSGILNMGVQLVAFHRLRKSSKQVLLYFVSSITMGMLLQNLISLKFSGVMYSYPKFFETRYINVGNLTFDVADLVMLLIAAVIIGALVFILHKTRLGIAVRALSMDPGATSLMGINVDFVVMATFFLAGSLAGVAGVFVGIRTVLSPQLGSLFTVKSLMVSVVGGLGSLNGALYAALLLGLVETGLTATIGSAMTPVGTFLFMLLFLIFRPQGIAGKFVVDKA
ncbi:branched-chain amino acid ABC transporter permease [Oscillospiraceae bacterium MB08-C2-2]|nr:branched-chain amino acid ABC transporter permease [Oscillospiraceae bacterium MB08-C2-2]